MKNGIGAAMDSAKKLVKSYQCMDSEKALNIYKNIDQNTSWIIIGRNLY
jgi:hypothetical protein